MASRPTIDVFMLRRKGVMVLNTPVRKMARCVCVQRSFNKARDAYLIGLGYRVVRVTVREVI